MRARVLGSALVAAAVVTACAVLPPPPAKPKPPAPPAVPKATRIAAMPAPGRTELSGAYWPEHGLIVVAAGFTSPGVSTSDVLFYDLATQAWSDGPALPGNRDHASLAVLGGKLYLVGGYTAALAAPTDEVWRLDTPAGTWVQVDSMNDARGGLATVAVNGYLVAIGGDNVATGSTEVYDPTTDTWTLAPNLNFPRGHLGAAAVGNKVYAIAGRPPNRRSVETLVVQSNGTTASAWTVAAPKLNFSRGGNGAAMVAGVPCTTGGEEAAGTIGSIECLQNGSWRHVADLRVSRHGLVVVGVGNRLHVISGGPQPGYAFSRVHEVYGL